MLLRNKDKESLLEIFSTVNLPMEVWAYGSRVSGKAHEGSDLDLVIRSSPLQKLPIEILMKLKEEIRESNIPIVVELFDWARLPESFHHNIEANHEVLFSNLEMTMKEDAAEFKRRKDDRSGSGETEKG